MRPRGEYDNSSEGAVLAFPFYIIKYHYISLHSIYYYYYYYDYYYYYYDYYWLLATG